MCEVKNAEFESNLQIYVKKFKEELEKRDSIEFVLDDDILIKFLRSRFYNIHESCKILETYSSLFEKYSHLFEGIDYSKKGFESGVIRFLNERGLKGETIVLFDLSTWNPSVVTSNQLIATLIYGLEFVALDENTQLNGCIGIVNMQSLGFRHLTKLGISEIQLSILIMDHSLPIKWQKLIIVNENSFTNITFKIGRPFLSNDLKDKLEFPGKDLKQLQKYVSQDILPSNFGGTAKCVRFLDFDTIKSGEQKLLKLWHPFKSSIE